MRKSNKNDHMKKKRCESMLEIKIKVGLLSPL